MSPFGLFQRRVLFPVAALALTGALTPALFPSAAAAHLDERLIGVSPSPPSEWQYYGLGPEESGQWIAEGFIFAGWASQWRAQGFNASSAGRWHGITNDATAGDFLRHGFGPEEAKEWIDQGIQSGLRASQYLAAGLDAREAATYWRQQLYPDDARTWHQAGFDAEEMLQWRYGPKQGEFYLTREARYSRTVYDLDFARNWRDAGFTPQEAHRAAMYGVELAAAKGWKAAGFSFDEAIFWSDSGFDSEQAAAARGAGLTALQAESARHGSQRPEDEITELNVDIAVRRGGRIDGIETVTVIDRPGGDYQKGFFIYPPLRQVKSVEVDGAPAGQGMDGGALRILQDGKPLPEGVHRIVLAYPLGYVQTEPHHDRFRYTVVPCVRKGNRIGKTTATIRLPKGADLIFADGTAGHRHRKDFIVDVETTGQGDVIRYTLTRPLTPGMEFSIDLGFVKGFASPPWLHRFALLDSKTRHFLSSLLLFVCGLTLTILYYLVVWFRFGRDPQVRGVSIPEFSPPEDLEPPRLRALLGLRRKKFLATAAELVFLAGKGYLQIAEREGVYKIERTERPTADLPPWERDFLTVVFAGGRRLILTGRRERRLLAGGNRQLAAALQGEFRTHTERNSRYWWPGLILAGLFFLASLGVLDTGRLLEQFRGGVILSVYASFQVVVYGLLALLFARLLRRPTAAHVALLARLRAYRDFLQANFAGTGSRRFVMPLLQGHLPYAMAAGIDVGPLMIARGEATWYQGSSGGFVCIDFVAAVEKSV